MRTAAAVLLASLVVPACGVGGENTASLTAEQLSDDGDEPGEDEPSSSGAVDGHWAHRFEVAESSLLVLGDFPHGWQRHPHEAEAHRDDDSAHGDAGVYRSIAECLGVDDERLYGSGVGAHSSWFLSPDGDAITSWINVETSPDDARFLFELSTSDRALPCMSIGLEAYIADRVEGDGMPVDVSFQRVPFPELGDQSAAFRAIVPNPDGPPAEVVVDFVTVRVGPAIANMQGVGRSSPFDGAELHRYGQIVVDRLRQRTATR